MSLVKIRYLLFCLNLGCVVLDIGIHNYILAVLNAVVSAFLLYTVVKDRQ
jgi:hypothetical protein